MSTGQLWNGFFLGKAANRAGKRHHTVSLLRCLFRNLALAEGMQFRVQPFVAAVTADRPVFIRIVLNFTGFADAVPAFCAVMIFPFCAFRTDSVIAAEILCTFGTAFLTQLAIGADFRTVFAFAAFLTESSAVGAVFPAVGTEIVGAVTAVVAVLTHAVGTVDTYAAVLTDLCTITALTAVFTVPTVRTFPTDIAGSAEFIRAGGADLTAFGAKVRAVFASLAAGTDGTAVRAESAVHAEAVRAGAVHAFAAFDTKLTVGAIGAFFTALHTDHSTVRTSAAAGADHLHTGDAERTFRAEVFLSYAVLAESAVHADFPVRAFAAMLAAVGADNGAFRASAAAVANDLGAVFAKLAGVAVGTVTACAVLTDAAVTADFLLGAGYAFFPTFGTDGGAIRASVSADADIIHAVFADTAFGTVVAVAAHTLKANAAFAAKLIIGTFFTFFAAFLTDNGTLIASVSADAQIFHALDTFAALGTKVPAGTVKTSLALLAKLIVSAIFAFFAASHTDYRAFRASIAAVADLVDTVFTISAFGAVVALTADAVKAYSALDTQLFLGTVCTLFSALGADIRALRASVSAGADVIHTHFAESAIGAIIPLAAAARKAYLTVAAQLIVRAVFTLLAAFRTDYGTF